jgi:predicted dehydrogenase
VVVSVKVPYHHELTKIALDAGKHVYTEWPLGANSEQAEELTELARARGVRHVIGLQGRKGPLVNYVRHLVADGYVGKLRSVSLSVASSGRGGATVAPDRVWAADRSNGATLLSIIAGHNLDVLRYSLGEITEVGGVVATLEPVAQVVGTDKTITVTSPDHVLVQGRLDGGAVVNAQFLATPQGSATRWSILGDRGALEVSGSGLPHYAEEDLVLRGSSGDGSLEELAVPDSYHRAPADVPDGPAKNVAAVYLDLADALAGGEATYPDFSTASSLHRLLDAIQSSSDQGVIRRP